jgi:hypothetical protein
MGPGGPGGRRGPGGPVGGGGPGGGAESWLNALAHAVFRHLDKNGNGVLEQNEFESGMGGWLEDWAQSKDVSLDRAAVEQGMLRDWMPLLGFGAGPGGTGPGWPSRPGPGVGPGGLPRL